VWSSTSTPIPAALCVAKTRRHPLAAHHASGDAICAPLARRDHERDRGAERVDEYFEGDPVWQGGVSIFELLDHPTATRCYAWETHGRVTAVLGVGPVNSALRAVQVRFWRR